jgi:hypothetical protein
MDQSLVTLANIGPGNLANGCQGETRYAVTDTERPVLYEMRKAVAQAAECRACCSRKNTERPVIQIQRVTTDAIN